jgi:hypothetical protein
MENKPSNEGLIVRYLLGDLPEEEQAQVEDRAFTDHEYLQSLLTVENDLIDEYVRGALSDSERRQFEGRFLASPGRQQRVELARALARVAPEFMAAEEAARPAVTSAPASWWGALAAFLRGPHLALKFSLAAAALILTVGGAWLIGETVRLRAQVTQLRAERGRREEAWQQRVAEQSARSEDLAAQLRREREQRERSEELTRQLQRERSERGPAGLPSQATLVSLALWPGISRSTVDRPRLVLPRSARLAQLQIGLERGDEYERFRAELRTREGQEVLSQSNLRARAGRAVVLNLPASALATGEYELALKGITDQGKVEDVGYYHFSVLKK